MVIMTLPENHEAQYRPFGRWPNTAPGWPMTPPVLQPPVRLPSPYEPFNNWGMIGRPTTRPDVYDPYRYVTTQPYLVSPARLCRQSGTCKNMDHGTTISPPARTQATVVTTPAPTTTTTILPTIASTSTPTRPIVAPLNHSRPYAGSIDRSDNSSQPMHATPVLNNNITTITTDSIVSNVTTSSVNNTRISGRVM